jgi:3-oxoacyl-[acyl-carrier-protein] synthase-3
MEELHSFQNYGMPINWMSKEMGIHERRMAPDEFNPSDLAIRAGREALDKCVALDPEMIDAVIFCGIERDQPEPATAHTIQNSLGLKANHVFDVANACYGFVDGLKLATALIESNMIKYALVVTGEVSTKVLKAVVDMLKKGVSKEKANTLWGALSLGDAGGAVILGQAQDDSTGFRAFNQRCDSRQVDRCRYKFRADGSVDGQMQMAQIVARGFQLNKGMLDNTLEILGWDGFDWALTHQTGKRTFDQTLTLKSINDDKLVKTYPYLGNITTATLPICLKKLWNSGLVSKGDRIGGLFAGSGITTGQFGYVV